MTRKRTSPTFVQTVVDSVDDRAATLDDAYAALISEIQVHLEAVGRLFIRCIQEPFINNVVTTDDALCADMDADPKRILTVQEAAIEAKCCDETIRRAYTTGHLIALPFGARGKRIRRDHLNQWLSSGMKIRPSARTAIRHGDR